MKYRDKSPFRLVLGALVCIAFGFLVSKRIYHIRNPAKDTLNSVSINKFDIELVKRKQSSMEINQTSKPLIEASDSADNKKLIDDMDLLSSIFTSTLRSCIGPECFDETVRQSDGSNIDRVGLLSPALSGGKEIRNLLMRLGKQSETGRKSKKPFIDLIYDTHVPAYGYGKNHGFSRIIRLSRKIIPHTVALVANLNLTQSSFNKIDITQDNNEELIFRVFDSQVRQLVRWHCRLSHVAAHTRMLTVFMEDILDRPAVELEKMLTFVGFKFARTTLIALIPNFITELKKSLAVGSVISNKDFIDNGDSKNIFIENRQIFPLLVGHKDYSDPLIVSNRIIQTGISAMNSELTQTNGLTKWPCESFRNLIPTSNSKKDQKLEIFISTLLPAAGMAANCASTFVTCSVPFDQDGG